MSKTIPPVFLPGHEQDEYERRVYGEVTGTSRVTTRQYEDGCIYALATALGPGGRPGRTVLSLVTMYPNGAVVMTPVDEWWSESDALIGMHHHHVTTRNHQG